MAYLKRPQWEKKPEPTVKGAVFVDAGPDPVLDPDAGMGVTPIYRTGNHFGDRLTSFVRAGNGFTRVRPGARLSRFGDQTVQMREETR